MTGRQPSKPAALISFSSLIFQQIFSAIESDCQLHYKLKQYKNFKLSTVYYP